jgi:hypothetical protein
MSEKIKPHYLERGAYVYDDVRAWPVPCLRWKPVPGELILWQVLSAM